MSFAYEVLSDPNKRQIYDRYGLKGLQEGEMDSDHDIISQLFGGFFPGMGGGMGGRSRRQKCEDTVANVVVTLEDLYNGNKTIPLEVARVILCPKCDGAGGKSGCAQSCKGCHGTGTRIMTQQLGPNIARQIHTKCPDCRGRGEFFSDSDRCGSCKGSRTIEEKKSFDIHIDKGMKHMQKVVLRGEGNQLPDCDKGDVIVLLQQSPHTGFERVKNDLFVNKTISLTEALCGFNLIIKQLDERDLLLRFPSGRVIKSGDYKAVKAEGMPIYKNPFEKGNLYIKFEIEFPANYFQSPEKLLELESYLPPRPVFVMPEGEHVEEVGLSDYDLNTRGEKGGNQAYESDDEEDPQARGVQCQPQ